MCVRLDGCLIDTTCHRYVVLDSHDITNASEFIHSVGEVSNNNKCSMHVCMYVCIYIYIYYVVFNYTMLYYIIEGTDGPPV